MEGCFLTLTIGRTFILSCTASEIELSAAPVTRALSAVRVIGYPAGARAEGGTGGRAEYSIHC
jgi:hypothetical protein